MELMRLCGELAEKMFREGNRKKENLKVRIVLGFEEFRGHFG
jgi:hypothetical protein